MTFHVEPALSPEEWVADEGLPEYRARVVMWEGHVVQFVAYEDFPYGLNVGCDGEWGFIPNECRHGLAAILLNGYPFGFTREDVRALRSEWTEEWEGVSRPNDGDALLSIADRIEALLPPESVASGEGKA